MDRTTAAAFLGVASDASAAEVRMAFRSLVRQVHPDAGGTPEGAPVDIDLATRARAVLLGPDADAEPDSHEPLTTQSVTRSTGPAATRSSTASGRPPTRRTGLFGLVWGVVLTVGGIVVVAAIVLGAVAVMSGGAADEPAGPTTDCVLIAASGARPVACSEPDAQQVVAEYSGARQCGSGANTLVVGATTWCLRPVD